MKNCLVLLFVALAGFLFGQVNGGKGYIGSPSTGEGNGASIDSVYESGDTLLIVEGGVLFTGPLLGGGGSVAILQNVQPDDSTHIDVNKVGWNTITLNTEQFDNIGASITGDSIFSLQPGTYFVTAEHVYRYNRFRIYDDTNDNAYLSLSGYSPPGDLASLMRNDPNLVCAFTISSSSDFKFQMYSASGSETSFNDDILPAGDEIFAQILIQKIN